jgi:hypothetical protein
MSITSLFERRVSMAAAVERIVVQATAAEKRAITAKARRLGLPVSELMRRGATAYRPEDADAELGQLADAAAASVGRAAAAIDAALDFIAASDARIDRMQADAAKRRPRRR